MNNNLHKKSQRIAALIVSYLKNKINKEPNKELSRWISSSKENKRIFEECTSENFFDHAYKQAYRGEEHYELIWKHIRANTISNHKQKILYRSLRIAASIIILISLGAASWFFYKSFEQPQMAYDFSPGKSSAILELSGGKKIILAADSTFAISTNNAKILNKNKSLNYTPVKSNKEVYNSLKTPRGGEYSIALSDGTRVYLNAESEFRYPESFTGDKRKVYLKGEAYFEVQHIDNKPFIVDVSGVQTRVLGTTFNIRSYPEENKVATTLIEGKVGFANQSASIILSPGEQATASDLTSEISVKEVNTRNYTAWHYGRLIYDNEPLKNILAELSRWYDFEVFYEYEAGKQIPFSCNLERYENLSELLNLLEKTYLIKFDINKESIVVKNYK